MTVENGHDVGRLMAETILGLAAGRRSTTLRRTAVGHEDIRPVTAFWNWVEIELERARRYDHQLAIVRFRVEQSNVRSCALWCDQGLRAIDRWCIDGNRLLVLAPETGREGADLLARRMLDARAMPLSSPHVACFPEDAVTRHGLEVDLRSSSPRHVLASDGDERKAS